MFGFWRLWAFLVCSQIEPGYACIINGPRFLATAQASRPMLFCPIVSLASTWVSESSIFCCWQSSSFTSITFSSELLGGFSWTSRHCLVYSAKSGLLERWTSGDMMKRRRGAVVIVSLFSREFSLENGCPILLSNLHCRKCGRPGPYVHRCNCTTTRLLLGLACFCPALYGVFHGQLESFHLCLYLISEAPLYRDCILKFFSQHFLKASAGYIMMEVFQFFVERNELQLAFFFSWSYRNFYYNFCDLKDSLHLTTDPFLKLFFAIGN